MKRGIRITVCGEYACFTRPEFGADRVSYDVITPSAARGILESIFWKPQIRWVVDRIQVNNKIQRRSLTFNEVKDKGSGDPVLKRKGDIYLDITEKRTQRTSQILRDVSYTIEAHFELTQTYDTLKERKGAEEKYIRSIKRRLANGQHYKQPCLGRRSYLAYVEEVDEMPESYYSDIPEVDLSWMFFDFDYTTANKSPRFYRPIMKYGIIEVGEMPCEY